MYAYIKGIITEIKPSYIVLDHEGIGYLILSPNPYSYQMGSEIKVYIYQHVREDIMALYGFHTNEARDLFIRLISVSGIGPKSAMSLLASDRIDDIVLAIEEGNIKFLTKFPGIGIKSAQQIVLDLKGKLIEDDKELLKPHTNDV
ncbi:MAG: Holliday junction branch migration protein RuvA, partial [Acholeplasmataceae bacterium]